MAADTAIAWTHSTFNPVIGCTKVGPGCDNCYAAALDNRMRWDRVTHWGPGVPRHRTSMANWRQPLAWNRKAEAEGKRRRVFCASLADVFDNEWPDGVREDLWTLIGQTPWLDWLLLTKRIGNVPGMVPEGWMAGFPAHVRLMITVVNQEEADRDIQKLLRLPCRNGISYEPALGAVDWRPWLTPCYTACRAIGDPATVSALDAIVRSAYRQSGGRLIEWLIVGGESGAKARPFDVGWARSTIAQCRAAGVPVFMKQLGTDHTALYERTIKDRAGADPAEWPQDLRIREYPA